MSSIDQAFIKAYQDDVPRSVDGSDMDASETTAVSELHLSQERQHASVQEEQGRLNQRPPLRGEAEEFRTYDGVETDPYSPHWEFSPHVDSTSDALPKEQPPAERRPLSSFAAPADSKSDSFHPMYEVDAFRWPSVTEMVLNEHRQHLEPVLERLQTAKQEGKTLVGLAGIRPGVGCTSIALCLARLLAEEGNSLAVVDANFSSGDLARSLGMEFSVGWEDVLAGKVPLAESAVYSLADRISVLPLKGPQNDARESLASIQSSVIAGVLRYHYDLVLFDLGVPTEPQQCADVQRILEHCRLDVAIIVADSPGMNPAAEEQTEQLVNLFGPLCLGVIGNSAA